MTILSTVQFGLSLLFVYFLVLCIHYFVKTVGLLLLLMQIFPSYETCFQFSGPETLLF